MQIQVRTHWFGAASRRRFRQVFIIQTPIVIYYRAPDADTHTHTRSSATALTGAHLSHSLLGRETMGRCVLC